MTDEQHDTGGSSPTGDPPQPNADETPDGDVQAGDTDSGRVLRFDATDETGPAVDRGTDPASLDGGSIADEPTSRLPDQSEQAGETEDTATSGSDQPTPTFRFDATGGEVSGDPPPRSQPAPSEPGDSASTRAMPGTGSAAGGHDAEGSGGGDGGRWGLAQSGGGGFGGFGSGGSNRRLIAALGVVAAVILIAGILASLPAPVDEQRAAITGTPSPTGATSGGEPQSGGTSATSPATDDTAAAQPDLPATPSPTPSEPTPTPSPSPSATGVPDDWEFADGSGYRFAHPADWQTSTLSGGTLQYRDPETSTYVRISPEGTQDDPVAEWEAYEDDFAARFPDSYNRIRIEPITVKGRDGAIWEYTYSDSGAQLHAVNIKIPTDDGGYAFNLQSHAERWEAVSGRLDVFLDAFQPGG